ncbi:MAG: hypothetical protein ABSF55_00225 [Candidatus Staskawiczbacteria bacterium]
MERSTSLLHGQRHGDKSWQKEKAKREKATMDRADYSLSATQPQPCQSDSSTTAAGG